VHVLRVEGQEIGILGGLYLEELPLLVAKLLLDVIEALAGGDALRVVEYVLLGVSVRVPGRLVSNALSGLLMLR